MSLLLMHVCAIVHATQPRCNVQCYKTQYFAHSKEREDVSRTVVTEELTVTLLAMRYSRLCAVQRTAHRRAVYI